MVEEEEEEEGLFKVCEPLAACMIALRSWAPSAQGGVTRQSVVLITYLLSFVIHSQ